MKRVPYCSKNGCQMINEYELRCPRYGGYIAHFVKCKQCNSASDYESFKVCPKCNHCLSCGRITKKKFYEK